MVVSELIIRKIGSRRQYEDSRSIEWRAGVFLVGVSAIFLGLLIVLTLARMDVGFEVGGTIRRTQEGWTLSVEVPGDRLRLLSRCRHVQIRPRARKSGTGGLRA